MILGITGKMLVGKSTTAEIIKEYCPEYVVDSFADKLKDFCAQILDCDKSLFESQEFKKSTLPKHWDVWRVRFEQDNTQLGRNFQTKKEAMLYEAHERKALQWSNSLKTYLSEESITVRELLQRVGVGMRQNVHPNFWINAYFSKELPNRVNASVRFLNEAEAIRERGGIILKVENPLIVNSDTHSSETELEQIKYDFLLVNDSTIADLRLKVGSILNKLNLVK